MSESVKYSVNLSFEEIKLPPFDEILVLGINSQHGRQGISQSFNYLIPNGFEILECEHENIDCVFVNKRITSKMSPKKIIKILEEKVFPYVSDYEILKVDFKIKISIDDIEVDFNNDNV